VKCLVGGGKFTLQGTVSRARLQEYFDEWVFRFNRRHARSRGLLFHTLLGQAVDAGRITYREMRLAGRTRPTPLPPTGARSRPASLDLGEFGLPWRGLALPPGTTTARPGLRHWDGKLFSLIPWSTSRIDSTAKDTSSPMRFWSKSAEMHLYLDVCK